MSTNREKMAAALENRIQPFLDEFLLRLSTDNICNAISGSEQARGVIQFDGGETYGPEVEADDETDIIVTIALPKGNYPVAALLSGTYGDVDPNFIHPLIRARLDEMAEENIGFKMFGYSKTEDGRPAVDLWFDTMSLVAGENVEAGNNLQQA